MTTGFFTVSAAVEGDLDEAVLRRLAAEVGLHVRTVYGKNGKGDLDRRLAGYNNAARFAPWVILRDLDHDAECPPELRNRLVPHPASRLCFRVPVRSTEAVPPPGISSEVGPAFAARLAEFVRTAWDPRSASRSAPSLLGALRALELLRDSLASDES